MSSPNNLEITGSLQDHPLAELLIELLETRLDGSLRLSSQTHKVIVYVRSGAVVYVVSNQRQHRIFEMLRQAGLVTERQLAQIPDFANDLALVAGLKLRKLFPEEDIELIVTRQIEVILKSAFEWTTGDWAFSPFARVREELCREIDIYHLMIGYARACSRDAVIKRFKSFRESFGSRPPLSPHINLRPEEELVLSKFEKTFLKIDRIQAATGLPDIENLQILYALWLGGFLYRKDWYAAFPQRTVTRILSTKLELKKDVAETRLPAAVLGQESVRPSIPVKPQPPPAKASEEEISLENYLQQVEKAETHYQILDVSPAAATPEIKKAYFNLAKRFHPDLFHKKVDAGLHARIQQAFTGIAHAYEVLRSDESRRTYDFKLKKILEQLEQSGASEPAPEPQPSLTDVLDIFDYGCRLLEEGRPGDALPYFSRVVHQAPGVARYHAFYGKALSADKAQRFKAEAEFQTAVKLEPQTPEFRLMLVEFCLQNNLVKRAEGELNRLLAISPGHPEALALLDSLRNK